jgi:lincosamide nucleotidyltransferase A/C/D/E
MSAEQPKTKEMAPVPEMSSADVVDLYSVLDDLGIEIWVDGGWGVDALLAGQSRLHKDLDIAIQEKDLPKLRELLEERGYKDVRLEEAKPWNFVMGDDSGHEIDVHAIKLDPEGNGIYGSETGYPATSLTGSGTIDGHTVRCISPESMIKFHSGYELKEKDFKDVSALCEKFGIELPTEYTCFKKQGQ